MQILDVAIRLQVIPTDHLIIALWKNRITDLIGWEVVGCVGINTGHNNKDRVKFCF